MKQDYARTIGYLALFILFIQILPFGPLFKLILTAVCSFLLIGIAFSISNLATISKTEIKKEELSKIKQERVPNTTEQEMDQETLVVEEYVVTTPTETYEERTQ